MCIKTSLNLDESNKKDDMYFRIRQAAGGGVKD